jgi:hypothetical protein
MFASYSSRTDEPIYTKLGMHVPWDQERILERSKLQKSILISRPSEGRSGSSETNHDRGTAPKPKLIASKRRLQKQGHNSEKTALGSIPGEDGFCSYETKYDTRMAPRQSCFFRLGYYRNEGHNSETPTWFPVPVNTFSVAWKLRAIKEHSQHQSPCFARKITGTNKTTPMYVLGSSLGENEFFSSESERERRTRPRPKLFVSAERLQEKKATYSKKYPCF